MSIFQNSFQGGPSFEIFSAQGANPFVNMKINPTAAACKKILDKTLKGNVIVIEGGATTTFAQIPKDEKKQTMGLIQPFLVFQIFIPYRQAFSIELSITDSQKNKRRIYLSTAFKEISSNLLHMKVPLAQIPTGQWMNLCFDLEDLVSGNFKGSTFRLLDAIIIHPSCQIRKIFTMKNAPQDSTLLNSPSGEEIPRAYVFPLGVENLTKIINMASVTMIEEEEADSGEKENKNDADKQKPKLLGSTKDGIPTHIAFGKRVPVPTPSQTSRPVQSKTPRSAGKPSKEEAVVDPQSPIFGSKPKGRNDISSPLYRSKVSAPLVSLSTNFTDRPMAKESLRYSSERTADIEEEIEYHPDIEEEEEEEQQDIEEHTNVKESLNSQSQLEQSVEPQVMEKSASIVKLKVEEAAKHKSRLSTLLESAKNSARNWRVEHKEQQLNDDVVFDDSLHDEHDSGSEEGYYVYQSKPSSLRDSNSGIATDSPRVSRNIKTQGTDHVSFEELNGIGSLKERRPVKVNVSVDMGSTGTEDERANDYDEDEEVEYYDHHEDYTPEVFSHQEDDEEFDSPEE